MIVDINKIVIFTGMITLLMLSTFALFTVFSWIAAKFIKK